VRNIGSRNENEANAKEVKDFKMGQVTRETFKLTLVQANTGGISNGQLIFCATEQMQLFLKKIVVDSLRFSLQTTLLFLSKS